MSTMFTTIKFTDNVKMFLLILPVYSIRVNDVIAAQYFISKK